MEIKISNYKFTSNIIGVLEEDSYLIELIKNLNFDNKNISINGKKLKQLEKRKFLNTVKIIDKKIDKDLLKLTVYQYMRYSIIDDILNLKNYQKKIIDSLNIVGLKNININKKVIDLSNCEKKLLQFATALLSNPEVIVFDSYLEIFDIKLRKKIVNLLVQLVEKYKKIVILHSNNSEYLYKYCKDIIVIKNQKKLVEGNIEYIFSNNIELLINNGFDIPDIVMFSYRANKLKNAKLNYHKDPRDLIKDIYKKV